MKVAVIRLGAKQIDPHRLCLLLTSECPHTVVPVRDSRAQGEQDSRVSIWVSRAGCIDSRRG